VWEVIEKAAIGQFICEVLSFPVIITQLVLHILLSFLFHLFIHSFFFSFIPEFISDAVQTQEPKVSLSGTHIFNIYFMGSLCALSSACPTGCLAVCLTDLTVLMRDVKTNLIDRRLTRLVRKLSLSA
jgi:hypothetical protein